MSSDKISSVRAPAASPTPALSPIVQLLPTGYRDIQPFQRGQGWHSNGKVAAKLRHAREVSERVVFPVIPTNNGSSTAATRGDATSTGPSVSIVDERFDALRREESDSCQQRDVDLGERCVASPPASAIAAPPPSRPRRPSSGSNTESNQRSSSSGSFRTRVIASSIQNVSQHAVSRLATESEKPDGDAIPEPDPATMEKLQQEFNARTKHPTKTVDTEAYHRKMQRRYNETKMLRERIDKLEMELEDTQRERDEALEAAQRSAQEAVQSNKWEDAELEGLISTADPRGLTGDPFGVGGEVASKSVSASLSSMSPKPRQQKQPITISNPEETSYREKAAKLERTMAGVKEGIAELQARLMVMHETDQATIECLHAQLQLEQRASKLLSLQLRETNAAFQFTADELVSTQVALEKTQIEKQIVVEQIQTETRQLVSDQKRKQLQSRVKNVIRTLGKEALHQKMEALHTRAMTAEHHMRVAQLEAVRLKEERDRQQQHIDEILSCREIKYHGLAFRDGGIPGILQRATTLYQGTRTVNDQFLLVHILYEDQRGPIDRLIDASSNQTDPSSDPEDGFCLHMLVYDAFTAQDDYLTFHLRDIQRLVPDAEKYLARFADRKKERFLELAELLFVQCHLGYKNGHIVLTERPSNQLELACREKRESVIYRGSRFLRSKESCGKETSQELLVDLVINEVHNPSTSQLWWLEVQATVVDFDSDQEHGSHLVIDSHVLKTIVPVFASYRPTESFDAGQESDKLDGLNAFGIHENLLEPLFERFEWRGSGFTDVDDNPALLLLDVDGTTVLCGATAWQSTEKSGDDEIGNQDGHGLIESDTIDSTKTRTATLNSSPLVLDHRSIVTIGETFFCMRIEEVWDGELMVRITMEEPDDCIHRYDAVLREKDVSAITAHLHKLGLCDADHSLSIQFGLPPSLHDPLCRLLKKHVKSALISAPATSHDRRNVATQRISFESLLNETQPPDVSQRKFESSDCQTLILTEVLDVGRRRIIQVIIVGEFLDEQHARELLVTALCKNERLLQTQRIGYRSTTPTFGIATVYSGFAPPLDDVAVIELVHMKSVKGAPVLLNAMDTEFVLSSRSLQQTFQILGLRVRSSTAT